MDETLNRNEHNVIRKSAFGRTNLFLTTKGVLLREIKSSSSTITRNAVTSIFHVHSSAKSVCKVCWHCSYDLDPDHACRIPRLYDNTNKMYHVYGWFCCAACSKAYILEHSTFDRGYQMNIFLRMLRDVYNINESITEAPPRHALQKYGGPFDIETFRKQTNVCTVVQPPFVSYCMLIEERSPISDLEEGGCSNVNKGSVRGLRRPETGLKLLPPEEICTPDNESMYARFLQKNEPVDETPDVEATPSHSNGEKIDQKAPKRQKKDAPKSVPSNNGLGRFMCK